MHITLLGVLGIHSFMVLAACGLLFAAGALASAWTLAGLGVIAGLGLLAMWFVELFHRQPPAKAPAEGKKDESKPAQPAPVEAAPAETPATPEAPAAPQEQPAAPKEEEKEGGFFKRLFGAR